jgi:hypothetical protein
MQTQSIVRASAQAITITTLTQGDVYKRLIEQSYSTDKYRAVVGIVQSVDFNGEDAMISALEVDDGKVVSKVFGTDADIKIFSASTEEVQTFILDNERTIESRVESARLALALATREAEHFRRIVDSLPTLTAAKTNLTIEGGA